MGYLCKECGRDFGLRRSLHIHVVRNHDITVKEYYENNYPKKDLLTGERIPYKSYLKYREQDFVSPENELEWINKSSSLVVSSYILDKMKHKKKEKGLIYAPPDLYFKIYNLPGVSKYEEIFGSYCEFINQAELKHNFLDDLPEDFWAKTPEVPTLIDTRERQPLEFNGARSQKLDFGDYTAAGEFYSKTFVERKGEDDFKSTFTQWQERFNKEMERCVEFNSYMFVVVESTVEKINRNDGFRKVRLNFLWHGVRELITKYPHNLQFIFAHSRAGAQRIIPKILYYGKSLWNVDLNYEIDKRTRELILRKEHVGKR